MKKYGFWEPVKIAIKNWQYALYFGIAIGIINVLIQIIAPSNLSLWMKMSSLSIFYILLLIVSIILNGVKVTYVHELISKNGSVNLKNKVYPKDSFIRGLLYAVISIIWSTVAFASTIILGILLFLIGWLLFLFIHVSVIRAIIVVVFVTIALIPLFLYSYISFLLLAYYSRKYKFEDAFKIKEIIKRSISLEYLIVTLKALLMGLIFFIMMIPFSVAYFIIAGVKTMSLSLIHLATNNILNISILYSGIIIGGILMVFISFVMLYYSYEGYKRTESLRR